MTEETNRVKSIVRYTIPILLAAILVYFVAGKVDVDKFKDLAQKADYSWVIMSIMISLIGYFARAYRWNLLIEPLGYKLNTSRTTLALMIGYLANLAFPRLGEITRCAILNKTDNVPVATSVGTVVTERIFDVIMLFGLLGFSLLVEYSKLSQFFTEVFSNLNLDLINLLLIFVGLSLLFIFVIFIFWKRINTYLEGLPFFKKIKELAASLIQGLLSFKKIENKVGFILSTLLIWVVYYFMSYIIIFSIPETSGLSWLAGVSILVGGGIALSLPIQGGFGAYHSIVTAILLLYGIEEKTGLFFATLLHTSQLITYLITGGTSLIITMFLKNKEVDVSYSQ